MLGALTAFLLAGVALASPAAAAPTVVASGLDRPRGLAFGPDGTLYAALVGHGGPSCDGAFCYGGTGRVVRVASSGALTNAITGLLSARGRPDGFYSLGADGVTVARDGTLSTVISAEMVGPDGVVPRQVPRSLRGQVGRVVTKRRGAKAKAGVSISAREFAHDADRGGKSSDPYAIAALGSRLFVADAGANAVLEARPGGARVLAVLPASGGIESVPDAIAAGPDGALYVGEFRGGGTQRERAGKARVWRLVPGREPTVYASGLTTITGLAAAPDGTLYASEFDPRRITRIAPGGAAKTVVAGDLPYPAGVAVSPAGAVYAAVWSVAGVGAGGDLAGHAGQIVRLG